jgi:hypothetical protein
MADGRRFDDPIYGFENPITAFEDPFFIELHKKLRSMDKRLIAKAVEQMRIKPERFGEIFQTGDGTREELEKIRRYPWP